VTSKNAVGDTLRATYDQLSRDPNSLANLDQDLPNYAQHQVPIFSLPQEWLWCESWCSDDSKEAVRCVCCCHMYICECIVVLLHFLYTCFVSDCFFYSYFHLPCFGLSTGVYVYVYVYVWEQAKTIDLCNNPLYKEPKLEMARRVVSGPLFDQSWVELDDEIRVLQQRSGVLA
jgi:hypothetical protein